MGDELERMLMKLPMSDHIRQFLVDRRFATIATLGPDGSPHQAAAWCLAEDDDVIVTAATNDAWTHNLWRNARVSLIVSDGCSWVELTGVAADNVNDHDQAQVQTDIANMTRYDNPDRAGWETTELRRKGRPRFRVRITAVHDHLEDGEAR